MLRWLGSTLCALLLILPLLAEKPSLLTESFEQISLEGATIGTRHTRQHTLVGKENLIRTTVTWDLTMRRYGAVVRLQREESTEETPEGHVHALSMRQASGAGKALVLQGKRTGERMQVEIDGGRIRRLLTWSDEVLGLGRQDQLFALRKVEPDQRFRFLRYDPTYNAVVSVQVSVKQRETVNLLGHPRKLLRVELTPDKLPVPGQDVRPPRSVLWLDEARNIVRRQLELEGLGTLILTRVSREQARAHPLPTVDLGTRSLIALDRTIPRPYDTRSITYRFTVRDEEDPASMLVRDPHQEVRSIRGTSFELLVHPVQPTASLELPPPGAEFLASNYFLDHADEKIQELSRRILAGESDDWKKALRLEHWVKHALRHDNAASLEPASRIARSLRGDCRHHALLTASLCRAAGIPARTAIGLLYVHRGGPKLGFHMWTEVWVKGKWLGIDSTLGKGGVSATHVKITEHSWHDTRSLTPLLPVNRLIGKLQVEVLRIE